MKRRKRRDWSRWTPFSKRDSRHQRYQRQQRRFVLRGSSGVQNPRHFLGHSFLDCTEATEEEKGRLEQQASMLIQIIRERVKPDSIVYTDSFQVYDVLDASKFHHRRVNHSKEYVNAKGHHINGIPKGSFYWFLKECEWRITGGHHKSLLNQLNSWYHSEINKP